MRSLMGLILASALLAGVAGESNAQVAVSVGNPYTGGGLFVGTPGLGYPGYGIGGNPGYYGGYNSSYNSGYLAGPGTFSYSSGYRGLAPGVGVGAYGSAYSPYYGAYGYRNYGYGVRGGFRPFGGLGRRFR